MKKTVVTTCIIIGVIFYTGFYTGQKFNYGPDNKDGTLTNADKISLADNTNKGNKGKISEQLGQIVKNQTISETDTLRPIPPHEQESTKISFQERENQFISEQETEVEMYEEMLVSMIENDLPEEHIEELKTHIEQINSTQFNDTIPDSNEPSELLTAEQMRDDMFESLKGAGHLSVEEREQMVYSMFPDLEILGIDGDTSILPHETNN